MDRLDAAIYYVTMAKRKRLISITDGESLAGLCSFFLLRDNADEPYFYDRSMWSCPEDYADGKIIYIDKLWVVEWSLALRREVPRRIQALHPHTERAVWYRPTKHSADRRVEVWLGPIR